MDTIFSIAIWVLPIFFIIVILTFFFQDKKAEKEKIAKEVNDRLDEESGITDTGKLKTFKESEIKDDQEIKDSHTNPLTDPN